MPKLIIRLLKRMEALRLVRLNGEAVPEPPAPVIGITTTVVSGKKPDA